MSEQQTRAAVRSGTAKRFRKPPHWPDPTPQPSVVPPVWAVRLTGNFAPRPPPRPMGPKQHPQVPAVSPCSC